VVFLLTGLIIVIADQVSKLWIITNIPASHIYFEAGFFRIINVHNSGAAFGLFQEQSSALKIIGVLGVIVILSFGLHFYRRFPLSNWLLGRAGLGLILGGTMGNLIDRFRLGYVIDFIDLSLWPTFNVADSAITVGIILFAYTLLRSAGNEMWHDE